MGYLLRLYKIIMTPYPFIISREKTEQDKNFLLPNCNITVVQIKGCPPILEWDSFYESNQSSNSRKRTKHKQHLFRFPYFEMAVTLMCVKLPLNKNSLLNTSWKFLHFILRQWNIIKYTKLFNLTNSGKKGPTSVSEIGLLIVDRTHKTNIKKQSEIQSMEIKFAN